MTSRNVVTSYSPWWITPSADSAKTMTELMLIHHHPASSPVYRVFPLVVGVENNGLLPVQAMSMTVRLPAGLNVVNFPRGTTRNGNCLTLPALRLLEPGKRALLQLLVRPAKPGIFQYDLMMEALIDHQGRSDNPRISERGHVKITQPVVAISSRVIHVKETRFTAVFSVKNTGYAPAFGTLFIWDLPPGYSPVSPFPGTLSGRQLMINLETITPGAPKEITLRISRQKSRKTAGTVEVSATGVAPVRRVVETPRPSGD